MLSSDSQYSQKNVKTGSPRYSILARFSLKIVHNDAQLDNAMDDFVPPGTGEPQWLELSIP